METLIVRRTAASLFGLGVVLIVVGVYVGLVYYDNTVDLGADFVVGLDLIYWVLILGVLLALVFVGLLVLYFTPVGVRPLEEAIAEASGEPEAEMVEEGLPPAEAEAETEALIVKCTNCSTEFELPYTAERPLIGVCPNCGQEAVLEEPEAILERVGPAVIDLEGIGPEYAQRLRDAGITTTDQLRISSTERVAQQTGVPPETIEFWKAMADLIRVKGIGKQYAELLARSGVTSIEQLQHETPHRLASKVESYLSTVKRRPTKGKFDEKKARKFIETARRVELDKEFAERMASEPQ